MDELRWLPPTNSDERADGEVHYCHVHPDQAYLALWEVSPGHWAVDTLTNKHLTYKIEEFMADDLEEAKAVAIALWRMQ